VDPAERCHRAAYPKLFASLVLVAVVICQIGCVHRRLTIRSNPPGALVYVDGVAIGRTPVSTSFIYYGTRTVRLELDGYETVQEDHGIRTPWYQFPPLDFVSDNLTPQDLRDERVLYFELVPMRVVPTGQLISRAGQLRMSSQLGIVAPLPGVPSATGALPTVPLPDPPWPANRTPTDPSDVPSGVLPFPSGAGGAGPGSVFTPLPQSPAWQYPGVGPGLPGTPLQPGLPLVQGSP